MPFLPGKSTMASVTFCSNTQDPEAIEKFLLQGNVLVVWCWTHLFVPLGIVGQQSQPVEDSDLADLDWVEKQPLWLCSSWSTLCLSSFEVWPGICWLSLTMLYYSPFQAWGCVTLGHLQLSQGIISKCFFRKQELLVCLNSKKEQYISQTEF